jgi:peptidoglycan/LPS O-acetylase OafA/YrhL
MDYRREIDGLRALAVLPVMLFHAGFETFSGGFVGVDVFFVISGYLITSIILAELEKGKFSIVNFYERRARRILPALFLVMFACIPFSWFWLITPDMKDFFQSLIAVSVFASNILFWRESSYFDTAAELKPLLHTWSLSVEEQYYVLFPLFLMLFWKLGKRWILVFLGLAFVTSLAAAQWAAKATPDAAFFLLPTRGWELLIGAFAAFYLSDANRKDFGKGLSEAGGWLGVALILYAVFAYSKTTPFPGFYALAPTLGTALVILFATQQTTVGKFVGNKAFVGVGLISYSAYLWHQPLFAFARYRSLTEPNHLVFFLLAVLALVLAYFSFKFVEASFRAKNKFSRKMIFSLSFLGSTFFITTGVLGNIYSNQIALYKNKNKPEVILSYELYNIAKATSTVKTDANRLDNGNCRFSVPNLSTVVSNRLVKCFEEYGSGILVFGDSHATNLFHSIVRNENNSDFPFLIGITKNGCHLPTENSDCPYGQILEFLQKNPKTFSSVIYEKAGHLMLKFGGKKEDLRNPHSTIKVSIDNDVTSGVEQYLELINKHSQVTWFGPRIEPLVTEREFIKSTCVAEYFPTNRQKEIFYDLDLKLKELSANKKWRYVSQLDLIKFNFPSDFGDCNRLLWMDMNHFSKSGEEIFGSRFKLLELIE